MANTNDKADLERTASVLDTLALIKDNGISRADVEGTFDFDTLVQAINDSGETSTVAGSSYEWLGSDKDRLVNVPFVVVGYFISLDAETGRPFATVYVITQTGEQLGFTDGSTGVMTQLVEASRKRAENPGQLPLNASFIAPAGLRVSEYGVRKDGSIIPRGSDEKPNSKAKTYYIA